MLEKAIVTFLKKHHLLTLATCNENVPYCASCFYAFDDQHATFIIATETKTRHGKEALDNTHVAGTIALETKIVGKIQGVQFTGLFRKASKEEEKRYLKRFPFAMAMQPSLWSIDIHYLKFTDNTLGFGKKLEFFRPNSLPSFYM